MCKGYFQNGVRKSDEESESNKNKQKQKAKSSLLVADIHS